MHPLLPRLLIVIALLAPAGSSALAAGAVGDLAQRHWTTRDGLPHNSLNDVVQTPDGYLWMATWEGLVRYNGREFLLHGRDRLPALQDLSMRALHVDHAGALWVGGVRGDLLRLADGVWTALPPAPAFVNALLHDRLGRLWVGMEAKGLLRIDPDGSRHVYGAAEGLPGGSVMDLEMDAEGNLWVASSGGLAQVRNERLQAVPLSDGAGAALGLALDAGGRLLVGAARGAFRQTAEGGFELLHPRLAGKSVFRLLQARDGAYWLGLSTEGLVRIQDGRLQPHGMEQGLPNSRVLALIEDQEAALWVATHGGLVRLWDAPFSSITEAHGLPDNFVRATLAASDGSVWIGSGRGLARWRAGRLRPLSDPALSQLSVLALAESPSGEVLVGSFGSGVLRVPVEGATRAIGRAEGLPSEHIRSLHQGRSGRLWIGTADGAARLDPGAERAEAVPIGAAGGFILALHEDPRGGLWIGTPDGLDHLDSEGRLQPGPALPGDTRSVFGIRALQDAPDLLWLSSDRGLLLLDTRDHSLRALGPAQGLPLEKIFHSVEDGQGQLWLNSNRGALRISVAQALDAMHGRAERVQVDLFDETHGMASSQCNAGSPAATLDAEGSLWIATALGVARLQQDRLAVATARQLPTLIESLRVDGREKPLALAPLRLGPGVGRLEVAAVGLGFLMPDRVRYRFMLEGFDADWVERGPLHIVEYTNLPPGNYRLRAQASYVGAPWDSPEARLEFSIQPSAWQRPGVQLLAATLTLLLVWLGYRARIANLRLRARSLRETVDRRTAELRATADQLAEADAEKTRLLAQLQAQSEAFERQAHEDALTGLGNRRAFDEQLQLEFRRACRSGAPLCLLLMDIDHFKRINDSYGHAAGDLVIQALADCMRRHSRDTDVLSRWGGEEFALLMPATRIEDALVVGERLRQAVGQLRFAGIDEDLRVGISLGLDEAGRHGSAGALLESVDAALYAAKRKGRNRLERAGS